ncbi:MAG: hypothetical protein J6X55_10455 [Victivallales bacterium]|nr:hypothetical protein [Victivallales bacterium]
MKIPDVATYFGIRCVSIFDVMRNLLVRLILG